MNFNERKAERREYYKKFVDGWKERKCSACDGTGYYDSFNSPRCGACKGTGIERYNAKICKYCQHSKSIGCYNKLNCVKGAVTVNINETCLEFKIDTKKLDA